MHMHKLVEIPDTKTVMLTPEGVKMNNCRVGDLSEIILPNMTGEVKQIPYASHYVQTDDEIYALICIEGKSVGVTLEGEVTGHWLTLYCLSNRVYNCGPFGSRLDALVHANNVAYMDAYLYHTSTIVKSIIKQDTESEWNRISTNMAGYLTAKVGKKRVKVVCEDKTILACHYLDRPAASDMIKVLESNTCYLNWPKRRTYEKETTNGLFFVSGSDDIWFGYVLMNNFCARTKPQVTQTAAYNLVRDAAQSQGGIGSHNDFVII